MHPILLAFWKGKLNIGLIFHILFSFEQLFWLQFKNQHCYILTLPYSLYYKSSSDQSSIHLSLALTSSIISGKKSAVCHGQLYRDFYFHQIKYCLNTGWRHHSMLFPQTLCDKFCLQIFLPYSLNFLAEFYIFQIYIVHLFPHFWFEIQPAWKKI